jgi:hypothetical protein
MNLIPSFTFSRSEGPAVLRLRLREVELLLARHSLGDEARNDARALVAALRRETLARHHDTLGDLAAKLSLICTKR